PARAQAHRVGPTAAGDRLAHYRPPAQANRKASPGSLAETRFPNALPPTTPPPRISISMPRPAKLATRVNTLPRELPRGEESFTQFDETVGVPRIVDEDGHGHEIGEAAAGAAQGLVDQAEDRAHLRLELAGNVVAGLVACRRLPGEPDDASALRDDGGRVCARRPELGLLEVLRHGGLPGGAGGAARLRPDHRTLANSDRGMSAHWPAPARP